MLCCCGVLSCCVRQGLARGKNLPCASSARLRVYHQNASVCAETRPHVLIHGGAESARGGRDRVETEEEEETEERNNTKNEQINKRQSHHVHQRFTESDQWILVMKSLRVRREQQVPNSFDHASCLSNCSAPAILRETQERTNNKMVHFASRLFIELYCTVHKHKT